MTLEVVNAAVGTTLEVGGPRPLEPDATKGLRSLTADNL